MIQSQQTMIILRLPDDMAMRMHELIKEGQKIEFAEHVSGGETAGTTTASGLDRLFMDVKPHPIQTADGDTFIFTMEGKEYPALLANMPTPVTVQKTFDQKTFFLSGDVGQVLQVFPTEAEFISAKSKLCQNNSGVFVPPGSQPSSIDSSLGSGLTPPTQHIVTRRYNLTRSNKKSTPTPQDAIKVVDEINRGWRNRTVDDVELEYIDTVDEDIVDFEDWMATDEYPHGITVTLGRGQKDWDDASMRLVRDHPRAFYQKTDLATLKNAAATTAAIQGSRGGLQFVTTGGATVAGMSAGVGATILPSMSATVMLVKGVGEGEGGLTTMDFSDGDGNDDNDDNDDGNDDDDRPDRGVVDDAEEEECSDGGDDNDNSWMVEESDDDDEDLLCPNLNLNLNREDVQGGDMVMILDADADVKMSDENENDS